MKFHIIIAIAIISMDIMPQTSVLLPSCATGNASPTHGAASSFNGDGKDVLFPNPGSYSAWGKTTQYNGARESKRYDTHAHHWNGPPLSSSKAKIAISYPKLMCCEEDKTLRYIIYH